MSFAVWDICVNRVQLSLIYGVQRVNLSFVQFLLGEREREKWSIRKKLLSSSELSLFLTVSPCTELVPEDRVNVSNHAWIAIMSAVDKNHDMISSFANTIGHYERH